MIQYNVVLFRIKGEHYKYIGGNEKMKKRVLGLLLSMVLVLLCGCGKDQPITSKWKFVESTINGKTMTMEVYSKMENPTIPSFSTDGKTCKVVIEEMALDGTVEGSDPKHFMIDFAGKAPKMEADIEEDTLVLINETRTATLVFEVDKDN